MADLALVAFVVLHHLLRLPRGAGPGNLARWIRCNEVTEERSLAGCASNPGWCDVMSGGGGAGDLAAAQNQADAVNGYLGRGPRWNRAVWTRVALAALPLVALTLLLLLL